MPARTKYARVLSILLLVAGCGLRTTAAPAPRPACGKMENGEGMLRAFWKYFVQPEYAVMRRSGIEQLDPDAPRAVVTDAAVCRAVLNAALRELRAHDPTWPRFERRGIEHTVLRYGPYYAVLLVSGPDPATGQRSHYDLLMVLRATDLRSMAAWLV